MSLIGILIVGAILGAIALTLYFDYLDESTLKSKLKAELPQTSYAKVESLKNEYGKEYGTTYYLKAHQKDGKIKNVEVKCKRGSISRYSRIYV